MSGDAVANEAFGARVALGFAVGEGLGDASGVGLGFEFEFEGVSADPVLRVSAFAEARDPGR